MLRSVIRLAMSVLIGVSIAGCSSSVDGEDVVLNTSGATPIPLGAYPGAPFEDHQGHLWISTVGEGLLRFDGSSFTRFTSDDGLGSNVIRGMIEDDEGTLWIATTGGLTRFDGSTFETLTEYGPMFEPTTTFAPKGDHRDVWGVMIDRSKRLWMTSMDGVFRLEDGVFVRFEMPREWSDAASQFGPRMVYEVMEDRDGNFWFATDGGGAIRWDGDSFTSYTMAEHGLCSDRICTIHQDRGGTFWFGSSDGGVSRFDGTTFETHLRSDEFSPHFGWGRCMAILEDRQGRLWFGRASAGGGVDRFDGTEFRYFGFADGLCDGGVPSLREDRAGHVWLGTTEGVYRYDGTRFLHWARNGWFSNE